MNRLATIFSIVTTVGILLAVVSGVVWIVAALWHRETIAKALCIAGIIVAVVGFAMFLKNYDSSLHQEREPQAPTTQTEAPEPPRETAQEPVSASSDGQEGTAPSKPQEPTETAPPQNPLAALGVQEHPVMNGFKTERIGTWASITTTKEFISGVSDQQLYDYLTNLPVSNYNWFNVFFEDGTGLWTISPVFVEYGQADQDEGGAVEYIGEPEECIFTFIDGKYSAGE